MTTPKPFSRSSFPLPLVERSAPHPLEIPRNLSVIISFLLLSRLLTEIAIEIAYRDCLPRLLIEIVTEWVINLLKGHCVDLKPISN